MQPNQLSNQFLELIGQGLDGWCTFNQFHCEYPFIGHPAFVEEERKASVTSGNPDGAPVGECLWEGCRENTWNHLRKCRINKSFVEVMEHQTIFQVFKISSPFWMILESKTPRLLWSRPQFRNLESHRAPAKSEWRTRGSSRLNSWKNQNWDYLLDLLS